MHVIAKNIARLRKRNALSQEQLAQRLHVTRQAVSHWETGRTQPDVDTLMAIADALDTDLTEILYGERPNQTSASYAKKRYVVAASALGAVVVTLIVLTVALQPLMERSYWRFESMAYVWFNAYGRPLLYACIAGFALSLISIWRDLRIRKQMWRRICFWVGIALFAVYALWMLGGLSGIFPINIGWLGLLSFVSDMPVVFLIPGALLFLGANR